MSQLLQRARRLVSPQQSRAWTVALLAFLAVGLMQFGQAARAAEPVSLPDFVSLKSKWRDHVGSQYSIFGRVTGFGNGELQMKGVSDLRFTYPESLARPRSLPYAVVTGRLVLEGDELRFVVTNVEDWKSERAQIADRIRKGQQSDPQLYYGQALWADQQADFYGDDTLHEEARSLRTQGIRVAQRRAAMDKPAAFLALADQVAEWKLDPALRSELQHDATRIELMLETRQPMPAYSIILNHLRERFPTSVTPLPEWPAELAEEYAKDPRATYAAADAETRPVLERLAFIEVATLQTRAELKPDGRNGSQIAAQLEQLAPEKKGLAAEYRDRELQFRERESLQYDRGRVLEFRQQLIALGQPERGQKVVEQWIAARFESRTRSPEVSIDRAEHLYEMLDDKPAAIELVTSALKADPQVDGGLRLLERMGYGWHNGAALPLDQMPALPPDPFAIAVSEGRVIVGMSAVQVRSALGGQPDSITRFSSQSLVTELWYYPDASLTVLLQASRSAPQIKVQRIISSTPRSEPDSADEDAAGDDAGSAGKPARRAAGAHEQPATAAHGE